MNPEVMQLLMGVGVMLAVSVVGGLVILRYRRKLTAEESAESDATIMESMRRAVDRGEMTQAEFDAIRARMIERMTGRAPVSSEDGSGSPGATETGEAPAETDPSPPRDPQG